MSFVPVQEVILFALDTNRLLFDKDMKYCKMSQTDTLVPPNRDTIRLLLKTEMFGPFIRQLNI